MMNMHVAVKHTPAETALIEAFDRSRASLPGDRRVADLRDRAMDVVRNGLPTRHIEAWHYTDLRRLLTRIPAQSERTGHVSLEPMLEGSSVLTVRDGRAEDFGAIDGVRVDAIGTVLSQAATTLPTVDPQDTVGSINTAFFTDGFRIAIAEGAQLAVPLELQALHGGGQSHSRFEVAIGAEARATIVERQTGEGDALCSSVSDVRIGDRAEVVWIIVQEQPASATHLAQFRARLGREAKLTLFLMNAGGKLVRQEILVDTAGEGSDFQLRGINLLAGESHTDVTMVLDHSAPGTTSREVIRNVATDRAHGVFQGRINVHQIAQKTDAKMACNTLLLSDDADFSAKPELEIFADDVACGHGATVTDINAQHLFYLMARGVPEKEARGLLVKAFVAEVIEELEDEAIIAALEAKLDQWFAEHG